MTVAETLKQNPVGTSILASSDVFWHVNDIFWMLEAVLSVMIDFFGIQILLSKILNSVLRQQEAQCSADNHSGHE